MPNPSPARNPHLAVLRAEVRAIESAGRKEGRGCLPFGVEAMDRRLDGGGLAMAALHEAVGSRSGFSDDAAASLFVAGIAARLPGTILWVLARRDLFAPGLMQAGLPPDRIIYAEARSDEEVLAVMEEGLRHGGLGAVVGEVAPVSMASTRRLQLAAEEGGVTALMLKRWRKSEEDSLSQPSAAMTRWRIACAPSGELPVEGIGRARWRLTLARQRGGEPYEWIMEASDAEGRLALPAEPPHRSPAANRPGEVRHAA